MTSVYLKENLTYDQARMVTETTKDGKDLFLKGICIQGGVKNANQRVYPVSEISTAVSTLNEQIADGDSVLGEVDHPDDLKINLDRVCHMITDMWMDGPNGYGKLKILPTPMGTLVRTMLDSGVKLGVSSRGSGNVNEATGEVSEFEIVTVDVVAQPSAPNAYPTAIYEGLLNMKHGHKAIGIAAEAQENVSAWQAALSTETLRLYTSGDPIGAELGGALKNVMAIACGATIGAGLGQSARAALITRGQAEITRFAVKLGAQPETLAGLAGFGDLCLTCTSEKSRNYQFGLALGQGQVFDKAITVEGRATALALLPIMERLDIDMPIAKAVAGLCAGTITVAQAMAALMARPLRKEI